MEAIVLAGGLGTRLRAAVPDLPKPMAPVAGRPFLEHLLDYWIGQGVRHFILSTGYQAGAILEHFGPSYGGVLISNVVEDRPLGTGGGLLLASEALGAMGTFLVLNGDTFFAVDLASARVFHASCPTAASLLLFRSRYPAAHAVEINAWGDVQSLDLPGPLVGGGVYLMERSFLPSSWRHTLPLSLEDDLLPCAIAVGKRVRGLECPGRFIDIGVPADYERAADIIIGAGG